MFNNTPLMNIAYKFLPVGAIITPHHNPCGGAELQTVDLDGDGYSEIILAYKWSGELHVLILKSYRGNWYVLADIKGPGYDINYMGFAEITGKPCKELIIGWQTGVVWSSLDIFSFSHHDLKKIVGGLTYSILEVKEMNSGGKGKSILALWKHVTADAYSIELLCWNGSGLALVDEEFPQYFRTVAAYYGQKVREMPQAAFYWYYLADAQIKAGMPAHALVSIERGMRLNQGYPTKNEFLALKEKITPKSANRPVGLYPASINIVGGVKWGYINERGEVVIKPVFDFAEEFNDNGLAIVTTDNLFGLIDITGKYVVVPKYSYIGDYSEGRAVAMGKNTFEVLDEQGRVIFISDGYIGSFQGGRAVFEGPEVQNWRYYGYIDRQGKIVIPPQFQSAGDFKSGKAVVGLKNGGYAIIGLSGEILKTLNYAFVGDISEGLLTFREKINGNMGYIDEQGNVIIQPQFISAEAFKNGRAVVGILVDSVGKSGLIDKSGRYIFQPQYNDIKQLGEGMAAVGRAIDINRPDIGSKYALADVNGNFLTGFIYYGISEFKNGLASAYDHDYTFFIDKTGKKAVNLPVVNGTGNLFLEDDLIKADVDGRVSYFDRSGKTIWRQNTEISLDNRYVVKEVKYRPNRNYLVYYPVVNGMGNVELQAKVNERLRKIAVPEAISSDIELDYNHREDFIVYFYNKDLAEIKFFGYIYHFGAIHEMPTQNFVHLDLVSGQFYELKDLFKKDSDYVKVLSDIIRKQMEAAVSETYFMEFYHGIKENQPFFITQDALHIYFDVYEIAPFVAGFPTFDIPFHDIMSIIDTSGAFWMSFHYIERN